MKISVQDLDLNLVPFSRRLARLMVLNGYESEAEEARQVFFIAYTNSVTDGSSRYNLIQMEPTLKGKPVPYTYTATPGKITIEAEGGTEEHPLQVEICFDGCERLLLRGTGLGLRFFIKFEPHEQFLDRLDGTVYAAFPTIGAFLFEPVTGRQTHNGHWDVLAIRPDDTEVLWYPDANGDLFGYIQYALSSVERPAELGAFDACAAENLRDFEDWCAKYEPVPERYAHVRLFAVYVIWICYLAPKTMLTTPMIYFLRVGPLMRAMGWHQSYHAMALWQDLDLAVDLLYSMFTLQDEHGMLPDSASDRYVTMLAPKPPFQGFALSYILDRVGLEALSAAHCVKLYEPMCRWADYWLTFRDRDKDGLVAYVHGDESGWDDASIFHKGMPVATPDIAAFLVLLMECCGKLAARLGKPEESEAWQSRSETMLAQMVDKFWNGEKFVCFKPDTGEVVDVESIAVYQPIILGKRLPAVIREKIGKAVHNPDTFFMPAGFASESQQSPLYDVTYGSFMLGMILAPVQLMMTVGLYNAGQVDVALHNARNWCEKSLEVGPQTIVASPPQKDPKPTGARPVLPPLPKNVRMIPGGFGSWGAVVFLVLGNMLYHAEKEGAL
ncbi:MAG: hypothetical protein LBS62_05420 [Clostridiales bacterium]|jgi:hypothetical protein|nr:hypothetical protein [Clostridiales bacterium]